MLSVFATCPLSKGRVVICPSARTSLAGLTGAGTGPALCAGLLNAHCCALGVAPMVGPDQRPTNKARRNTPATTVITSPVTLILPGSAAEPLVLVMATPDSESVPGTFRTSSCVQLAACCKPGIE